LLILGIFALVAGFYPIFVAYERLEESDLIFGLLRHPFAMEAMLSVVRFKRIWRQSSIKRAA
jgi:hypothetical protein